MWLWIKRLFGKSSARPLQPSHEAAAKMRLQSLREDELSVGAHLRRGASVTAAPRQAHGDATPLGAASMRRGQNAASAGSASPPAAPSEDFALSMAVSAGSGSTVLGYAVGGSLVGALAGSSFHQSAGAESLSRSSESTSCDSSQASIDIASSSDGDCSSSDSGSSSSGSD
jgi:hypothetical protein